ncbi:hypothetical protein N7492_004106 [Penicillium capsulatum]|uniref:Uncharacterized protein n=1 Tax=Penicillium capsulatum TaxID=69766 RepID=A0A9W9LWQ8_9EURO|nr:hypothetical protein N7492_004106 [Penicillium capsulatum]KAJ6121321.1 hypothetical protein N7512_003786 [Penicillium capsulatum]
MNPEVADRAEIAWLHQYLPHGPAGFSTAGDPGVADTATSGLGWELTTSGAKGALVPDPGRSGVHPRKLDAAEIGHHLDERQPKSDLIQKISDPTGDRAVPTQS